MNPTTDLSTGTFSPVSAETGEACQLAMQELWLTGKILPVGARLVVRHTFQSAETKPLEVVYAFALPRDATLRRFRVTGEKFSVRSELKRLEEAREAYEEAIEGGHLGVFAQQYGDGVVNLNLGNLRPGEGVTVYLELVAGVEPRDTGFRFRFPFTLAPTYHAKAKAIEVEPGQGEMELPPDEFGDVLLPRWVEDATSLHRVGFDLSVSLPGRIAEIASPSHPLRVLNTAELSARVLLATEGDVPDRDLVLDVGFQETPPQVLSGVDKEGRGRFAVVVPSDQFGSASEEPVHVAFVLDRSGSMSGVPMQQALRSVEACLGALSEADRFGIVAFDNEVTLFGSELVQGTSESREAATRFLATIDARGGTELLSGLTAASNLLAGSGGDIFLLTDGQVSGTDTVIQQAKNAGIRIHCLGIGSASQDRFLSLLARQTGGVSRFVTARERVDMTAVELFAAAGRPVASDVAIQASGLEGATISPAPASAVFAGTPLVVFGTTGGEGEGELHISWQTHEGAKDLMIPVHVAEDGLGEVLCLLQGARSITDLETQMGPEEVRGPGKRRASRARRSLETLSLEYGLTCRLTALVAVVEREGDMPGEVPKTTVVPVGMPRGVMFESYFDRAFLAPQSMPTVMARRMDPLARRPLAYEAAPRAMRPLPAKSEGKGVEDVLLKLAGIIEPDGGLPGDTEEERVMATLTALLLFAAEGHTPQHGAFSPHVRHMLSFLESVDLAGFDEKQRQLIAKALEKIKAGSSAKGGWLRIARSYLRKGTILVERFWEKIEREGC